ncbi:MAG: hypothetical protein AB8B85_12285 [Paracoccaceae bacterium]
MTDRAYEIFDLDDVVGGADPHHFDPYRTFKFQLAADESTASADGKLLTIRDFISEQEY